MVTFDDVKRLAANASSPCLAALGQASACDPLDEVGPGKMLAGEALATYEIRRRTAADAGIDVEGIDETVGALRKLDADAELFLFHFSGRTKVSTVFVTPDARLIGCVCVERRSGPERAAP